MRENVATGVLNRSVPSLHGTFGVKERSTWRFCRLGHLNFLLSRSPFLSLMNSFDEAIFFLLCLRFFKGRGTHQTQNSFKDEPGTL